MLPTPLGCGRYTNRLTRRRRSMRPSTIIINLNLRPYPILGAEVPIGARHAHLTKSIAA